MRIQSVVNTDDDDDDDDEISTSQSTIPDFLGGTLQFSPDIEEHPAPFGPENANPKTSGMQFTLWKKPLQDAACSPRTCKQEKY